MTMNKKNLKAQGRGLASHNWQLSYRTSAVTGGRPLNILHEFYIPALRRANRYDRMAGYFRSSSLAAASQGFSAFVGRGGKMRLVVGADMEADDVKAILAGDKERLARELNKELEQPATWPQDVYQGVTLLGWMVAHGHLEVRIAFRIHGHTREPLFLDALDDGYVHEKWFILTDEFGQRLYGTGTLNESRTALIHNAENIDIHCDWLGGTDAERVKLALENFEHLWQNKSRCVAVVTIPEAVRRRLISLSRQVARPREIDGSSAQARPVSPSPLERLKFAVLKDAPHLPAGRYVGLETAPVAPWPHQRIVAHRLVESWPHSYLLCDEVGLGKTIEAGLAFRSLYLTGLARRILVVAPASLTAQWQRQMAIKLLLPFARTLSGTPPCHCHIFPQKNEKAGVSLYSPDLLIVSTGLLARENHREALFMAEPFAIALLDEAHAARRQNPAKGVAAYPHYGYLYQTVDKYLRQKAQSLWLATATPMQIHPVEVCDLLALTNRVGAFQYDATLTLEYYAILAKIVAGQDPEDKEWELLRRSLVAIKMQDPLLWRFIEHSVIDGRIRLTVERWLKRKQIPQGRDRRNTGRLLFSASPLSRVMLRHTRRLLEIYREEGQLQENLARRHILRLPRIAFAPLEQQMYEELEYFASGLSRQISQHGDGPSRTALGFLLSFFRLRFASSLYALRETLKRRLIKVQATLDHHQELAEKEGKGEYASLEEEVLEGEGEDDRAAVESLLKNRSPADLLWEKERLKDMISNMADLRGPSPKMSYLLRKLDHRRDTTTGRIKQTVIFTRFYDTLQDIVGHLRRVDPRMLLGTYTGQGLGGSFLNSAQGKMVTIKREEVREMFLRGEIDVLICTDAAAEGLNLQTADLLVNFDLGWNPMKIEQRIGRIDRIGQRHKDIYVLNLCYVNTAEETVYGRLLDRLSQANLIVGTQQLSLLPVRPDDFRKLAERKMSEEELVSLAKKRIKAQQERTRSMEIAPRDLYNIYTNMDARVGERSPVFLSDIHTALWESDYLRDLGCTVETIEGKKVLRLTGVAGVPDGAILTTDRTIYEEGLVGEDRPVNFASYGDPYFEALLTQVAAYDLPPCIKRLAVAIPDLKEVEMVAYVVAGRGEKGGIVVHLVKSWADLKQIDLAKDVILTKATVEPLQQELAQLAEEEFKYCRGAKRIEGYNIRAGRAQQLLRLLFMRSWLKLRCKYADKGVLFWPLLAEMEEGFRARQEIFSGDLPISMMRPISEDLLFEFQLPTVGDKTILKAQRVLIESSLDAARQVADRMKEGKASLRADRVLAALEREIEKWR